MEIISFLVGSVTTTTLLAIAAFLSKTWIEKRLEFSIQHEYDKKLSNYETEKEIRLKAELISELMSEWINTDKEDVVKLNELTFKAFLWLPAELASDLSNTLSHQPGADDLRTIICKVRKHLLGNDDKLQNHEVIVFPKKTT
ncbi:TPA: hypothetical protein I7251_22000 [Vibrio vulnificus]|nr:hypothetical protein [Vibrio vulnificus]HAS6424782.1 hypothetical protein [Vibrio vulnificus]